VFIIPPVRARQHTPEATHCTRTGSTLTWQTHATHALTPASIRTVCVLILARTRNQRGPRHSMRLQATAHPFSSTPPRPPISNWCTSGRACRCGRDGEQYLPGPRHTTSAERCSACSVAHWISCAKAIDVAASAVPRHNQCCMRTIAHRCSVHVASFENVNARARTAHVHTHALTHTHTANVGAHITTAEAEEAPPAAQVAQTSGGRPRKRRPQLTDTSCTVCGTDGDIDRSRTSNLKVRCSPGARVARAREAPTTAAQLCSNRMGADTYRNQCGCAEPGCFLSDIRLRASSSSWRLRGQCCKNPDKWSVPRPSGCARAQAHASNPTPMPHGKCQSSVFVFSAPGGVNNQAR